MKVNKAGVYSYSKFSPRNAMIHRDKEKLVREHAYAQNLKEPDFDYSVEVYNSRMPDREPDTIGLNVMYPSLEAPTHILTKEIPITVESQAIRKALQDMCKELRKKFKKKVGE